MSESQLVTIHESCEILDHLRVPLNSEERSSIQGNIPYYGANGIQGYINNYIFDEELILLAEDGGYFEDFNSRPIAYKIKGKSWVNNHAHILRTRENYFLDFVFYSLQHKNIVSFIKGGTRSKLNQSELKEITFWDAPYKQQQKIANILSTVDQLIEQTQALIEKYTAIKQGMMADLFTRGIDPKTKQLRPSPTDAPELYKETELGLVPKEWEVGLLNVYLDFLDSMRIPLKQEERTQMQGHFRYYGASGVIDYVNDYIFDGEFILLGEDGENVLSRNVPLAFKVKGKIWVNNHAHIMVPNQMSNIDYFTEYLESLNYENLVSGSAQPKITQKQLSNMLVKVPKLNEQTIVFERLYSLIKKIRFELEFMKKLKNQKKGLMQDLLTGRIRVK